MHSAMDAMSNSKQRYLRDPRVLLVLLAFTEKNILRYAVYAISMIPVVGLIGNLIIPTMYIFLILLYCKKYGAKTSISSFLFLIFIFLSIFGTCIFYPQNVQYIFEPNNFWYTIFPCLRYFIVALVLIADDDMMDLLGKVSEWGILIEAAYVLLYMVPRGLMTDDEMSRAYQLLPNVLFCLIYLYNNKKNVFAWMCSIVGIIYVCSMGTRGPVLIMIAFLFLMFIKNSSSKIWTKILLTVLIGSVIVLIMQTQLYMNCLVDLQSVLKSLGVSTRVLDIAIRGETLSHVSERDILFQSGFDMIRMRPLLGYGVYGAWPVIGYAVHNLYLEFWIDFGIIGGTVFLLWIVQLVLKVFFKTMNENMRDLIIAFGCFVFIRGFVSGGYLTFGMFFLIGMCLNEWRRIKWGIDSND